MKTLTLIFGCLLLSVIASSVFAEASTDRQAAGQNQKERLQDIRDTAARERQAIEDRYLVGRARLKLQALKQAQRIILFHRVFWTEFISESYQRPYADNYIYKRPHLCYDREAIKYDSKLIEYNLKARDLRAALIDFYFVRTAEDFLMDANARKLLADIVNINRDIPHDSRNLLFIRETEKLLAIMDYFAILSANLENQRANELAELQIWEESSIADAQKAAPPAPAEATPYGTVIAVINYNKDSFCMIEGIDEIIKVGDTINNAQTKNVKIVKIDIDRDSARVEFDRNGRQWAQTVGQPPNPAWK
jgi:hypothetical protein